MKKFYQGFILIYLNCVSNCLYNFEVFEAKTTILLWKFIKKEISGNKITGAKELTERATERLPTNTMQTRKRVNIKSFS